MVGQVSHEVEVNVSASEAWELYGTLQFSKLVEEVLSNFIEKIEVIEGDGGVGTIIKLIFAPGTGFTGCKEKFTKVDNESRVKETEVIEGGFLELGFTLYRDRFEVIKNGNDSCIIRSTIEYELKEDAAANASLVSIEPLANVAELAKNHLLKSKTAKDEK
ncbi:hypothetical protein RGQ29_030604 [Quercus rubra]|uniref:Bet v I/Major latex protein domain-containing protein n=1 Tax=Quercus rubra TaxID=3512 RepID=A0AAN7II87_QUERU|nr:hypothetical protein RGQ29_030604 [Quercus rubra]